MSWISLTAQVVIALVAVVAVIVGWYQLREARAQRSEARRLRREEAQPYVAVLMEPSAADEIFIDLVVVNLGATAARDVRVTITPPPVRSEGTGIETLLLLPEVIPTLVPGQRWRTFWDGTHMRKDADVPSRYEATATFVDSFGERHSLNYILDWQLHVRRGHLVVYDVHHVAKALRDIASELGHWRRTGDQGLQVWARDGDARADREREREDERGSGGSR